MKSAIKIASIVVVSGLAACATRPKYEWGSYDTSLYTYYKDPSSSAKLAAELQSLIESADSDKSVVAPGLYAEYGYLLYQQGNLQLAVVNFNKEKAHWPESTVLMDRMILLASQASPTNTSRK